MIPSEQPSPVQGSPLPHGLAAAVLDALPVGVAIYDDVAQLRYVNPVLQSQQAGREMTLQALVGAPAVPPDNRLPRPGTPRGAAGPWYDVTVTPLPDGGSVRVLMDVTALLARMGDAPPPHRAEQAVQDRAALLGGVLAALPHGVCVYGPDGRVRMVNVAYQRIMVGAEAAVGEHHGDIVARRLAAGEYDEATAAVLRRQITAEGHAAEDTAHEQIRTRSNGTVISVRTARLPDRGLVVVMTDVTARTQAEAELARQAAALRAMLDHQPDGVALFDAGAHLIIANALAERMTGLSEGSMVPGRHLSELRAQQLAAREFGEVEGERQGPPDSMNGHRLVQGRYVRRRRDGSVLEVRTDTTPDGGFIRTYRDVTDERRARAELEAARNAAEAASRAKSGFLATMTHELRTPLHAVIGFSEAILNETRPEIVRTHAEEVLVAGRQLLGLVDGLLEATRIEAGTLSLRGGLFDLGPVLQAASLSAGRLAEAAGVAFQDGVPEALAPIRGDAARLRQVLDALLSNAVKFTPAGGRVALSIRPMLNGGTEIVVTDTGIGMAPADIPRAFEAFTQLEGGLNRRYPGSGLGLYLARALAGAMGMALSLDSTPRQGTTARLSVPPAKEIAS